ncbi:hypothetical protein COCVIDRAFT_21101 [Bipolaris victoriae FI3]|uniref:Uncharacterized protein n=1 Tax=Bipolaris victoriae (strain FI3) TaxID=930091 RepID=W7E9W2_BIPV3|nr:hypothetical protein COCVIDRAFT_21101 [Bipolaris victoriae FI3]
MHLDGLIYCSIGKGRGSGQSKEYQMQPHSLVRTQNIRKGLIPYTYRLICWYFCLAHGSFPTVTSNQSDRSNDSGTGASADQTNTSRTNGDRGQAQGSTQEESESVAQTSVAVPVGTLRVSNSSAMGQEYHEYYNYGQNDKKPNGTQ